MSSNLSDADSLVVFRNSQGEEGRGTLIHLTRNLAVFEVYNPYSIVQLSEVVDDLRVIRGGRTVYSGRAVASNIVATGLMIIVSATLVDPWSDLAGLTPGDGLREEVERFVDDWETSYSLQPDYQVAVTNFSAFLSELSRWLEQAQVAAGLDEEDVSKELEQEFLGEITEPVAPRVRKLFYEFEDAANRIPDDQEVVHKAFARRELHPLLMCAPFMHRTFEKPLGYAGDYEMVNMILRNRPEGRSLYAKLVNAVTLQMDAAEAHRNRIQMLVDTFKEEVRRKLAKTRPVDVLCVGCGPAREVERFIREEPACEKFRFNLLDFEERTLQYTRRRMAQAMKEKNRDVEINYLHKSIHQLLKEVARQQKKSKKVKSSYDLVYCAGLFDYLSDRVCKKLVELFYQWNRPDGLVVCTNVHPNNPDRHSMEHLLEWNLKYRDEGDMKELAPDEGERDIELDPTGVNIFLKIRKSTNDGREARSGAAESVHRGG